MRGDALLELTSYAIRHTIACEMRRRGVPVWEVAGFLGHSTGYRTTERYAKYGPDHLGAAVRAIDAYFAELGVADRCHPAQIDGTRQSDHGTRRPPEKGEAEVITRNPWVAENHRDRS